MIYFVSFDYLDKDGSFCSFCGYWEVISFRRLITYLYSNYSSKILRFTCDLCDIEVIDDEVEED